MCRWLSGLGLVVAIVGGCDGTEGKSEKSSTNPEPLRLQRTSVVRLKETDSVFIGLSAPIAVSRNNEYFITDAFSHRILHYDSAGNLAGILGREGNGPDEFVRPTMLAIVDDTTLLVADEVRHDVVLWDLSKNRVRDRLRYTGAAGFFDASGGHVLGTFLDFAKGTMAIRWSATQRSPQYLGKLPQAFVKGSFGQIYGRIPVVTYQDTVAYVVGDADVLRIADSTWTVIDSIPIPRRVRRGIPAVLDTNLTGKRNITYVMNQVSALYGLYRLSNNRFAVVHLDATIRPDFTTVGAVYLTVINRQIGSPCVDLRVPVHDTTISPFLTFRGDSMYVLDLYSDRNGTKAFADVDKFVIGKDTC